MIHWFKPKHSVCKECGVHFEPAPADEARWGDLCKQHREAPMQEDRKRDIAIEWAKSNWKTVYALYEKEISDQSAALAKYQNAWGNYNAQQAARQQETMMNQPRGFWASP